ncbi:MAG: gliding motility-associated C-terminal domain-containing protein [Bacteroidia bacterium]|jgi:hypothetical protein|nr:gliding motility-associated C-terminal domain-containing protein [Bacteroidia bacterium]
MGKILLTLLSVFTTLWTNYFVVNNIPLNQTEVCAVADEFVFNRNESKYFKPQINCVFRRFELIVYAPNGAIIYKGTNKDEGWNGFYFNNKMPVGTYPYEIRVIRSNKPAQIVKGKLHVYN